MDTRASSLSTKKAEKSKAETELKRKVTHPVRPGSISTSERAA